MPCSQYSLRILLPLLMASLIPAQTPVQFTVDLTADVHPISPWIYGANFTLTAADGVTFFRSGGNRLTGYNWENNASNAGTDYLNESDAYLGNTSVPGKVITDFQDQNLAAGAKSLVTLQAAGYVARDKSGPVDSSQTAPSARWRPVSFVKGAPFALSPDTSDNAVYMDEEVNFLTQKYGPSSGARGIMAYNIDNEPALWPYTHPRIHPKPTGAAELVDKNTTLSKAVKNVDSTALIFGGVFYGYAEYANMQSAADWSALQSQGKYDWYIDYFLDQMRKNSETAGRRLLDVLDLHWYPEATGDNRITNSGTSSKDVTARVQAPRSLWDSTYVESSWITQSLGNKPINLIPRVIASINKYYPGTRLSISEYNYGAPRHVSGGIATADFLGVLGRMDVFAACLWPLTDTGGYHASAFRLFRNYDGKKSNFGNTSARAVTSNQDLASIYAGFDGGGNAVHLIVLNKSTSSVNGSFTLTTPAAVTQGRVFGFDQSDTALSEKTAIATITGNAFTYTLPPLSATHFVLQTSAGLGVKWIARKALPHSPVNPSLELLNLPNAGALKVDGRRPLSR